MGHLSATLGRVLVTLSAVFAAGVVGWQLYLYSMVAPWTRDGRVRADVIAVAPDVSGLVSDVVVSDNRKVNAGDLLFRIDPDRFTLALRQSEAIVAGLKAAMDYADAELARYSQLSDVAVSREKLDQVQAATRQAHAALEKARADHDLAKLNLIRSEVRASVAGTVTNMDLQPGSYVTAGHGVLALIATDTIRVEGYFEETKLARIKVGDPVTVRLMGESTTLSGRVESIAGGIEDRDRSEGAKLMANVNPSFTWLRLAQRVPVRIKLDASATAVRLIPGRTATVSVFDGEGSSTNATPSWPDRPETGVHAMGPEPAAQNPP